MTSDYRPVSAALKAGTDPALLCATCPWDRFCITPPAITTGEIDAHMAEAAAKDRQAMAEARARGEETPMPGATLMTALMMGGRDQAADICPVLALRMRTSEGRKVVDQVKAQMQGWDDAQ